MDEENRIISVGAVDDEDDIILDTDIIGDDDGVSDTKIRDTECIAKNTNELHGEDVDREGSKGLSRGVVVLCVLIIGILDSVGAAMPLWCFAAVTLGFGAIFILPVPMIIYIVLGRQNISNRLLEVSGKATYVAMRIIGFIIGQMMGVTLFCVLPFVSLGPNSASSLVVFLSYAACTIGILVCARMFRNFIGEKAGWS